MNSILLALIALLLTGELVIFAIFYLILRSIFKKIICFITPETENQESPISLLYGILIKRLATEFRLTLIGQKGGENKGESYAERAAIEDVASEVNPTLGAILTAFPSIGKALRKNPMLLNYALSKIKNSTPVPDNHDGFAGQSNKYG